jgi:hypothetical protein
LVAAKIEFNSPRRVIYTFQGIARSPQRVNWSGSWGHCPCFFIEAGALQKYNDVPLKKRHFPCMGEKGQQKTNRIADALFNSECKMLEVIPI